MAKRETKSEIVQPPTTTEVMRPPWDIPGQHPRIMPLPVRAVNNYLREESNCFLTTYDEHSNISWETVDWAALANPNTKLELYACVEMHTKRFLDWAQWWPLPIEPTKKHPTWSTTLNFWHSGMQAYVVHSVYFLVNTELELATVNYCLLNNREDFCPLGVLNPEYKFTKLVVKRAQKCMRQFLSPK